jgi:hypothetical protein
MRFVPATVVAVILAGTGTACATLGQLGQLGMLVQPPRFDQALDQPAEIRLLSPTTDLALGGAGIRLWTKVSNPNGFGFTLSTLRGTLFLDDARTTTVDLPLGLPLAPRGETVLPIDLVLSFSELPGLRDVALRALRREPIAYRFEGTVGVDAGRFGTPEFGPMTLLRGSFH